MNRDPQFQRDKKLLALHRERRVLRRQTAQTIEIDPPIPRGWVRHWRLTARAKKRHDAPVLKTILQQIDNPRFHWRHNFEPGKRQRRRMIENTQALRSIREHRWKWLGWPEDWKIYFRKVTVNPGRPDQTIAYKLLREDLFELFTERHYVRRLKLLDPTAESREAEIDLHLVQNGLHHRLDRLLDSHWQRGPDPRQQKLNRLAARRLRLALNGDLEAEARRKMPFSPLLPPVTSHSPCSCSPISRDTTSRSSPVRM